MKEWENHCATVWWGFSGTLLPPDDPAQLWECVVLLETARKHSRTNPMLQLLLWKLYAFLGAVEFCTQFYNFLAIKHIQIDTIG